MRSKNPVSAQLLGEEVQKLDQVLLEGSDLAVALIASSFLDECLWSLLSSHLRSGDTSQALLRSGRGAIGTYSARTDLAYSLQLIDKAALKALRTIDEIRNSFAHSYDEASFEYREIAQLCSKLSYAYDLFIDQGRGVGDPEDIRAALDDFFKVQRNRFTYTCVTLGQTLIFAAKHAAERAGSRHGV